jgi:hypothetical protein
MGECLPQHPLPETGSPANHERGAREFLKFLQNIDKARPARSDIHLMLNNYATDKTPNRSDRVIAAYGLCATKDCGSPNGKGRARKRAFQRAQADLVIFRHIRLNLKKR